MPALVPTDITARITWIGRVADSAADLRAEGLNAAELTFGGIAGECHGGETRLSCSRVIDLYPRGTVIRNVRQLSILSAEDMAEIAAAMELEALPPAWLGASLVLEGIADFSHLPPSARLQAPSGATLTVDMQNLPCNLPARVIEREQPGHGRSFKRAAEGRRGVTAWVEREGRIALGDRLRLFLPGQRGWRGMEVPATEAAEG
ncbi:MOSC domain-containing protein [Aquicoccus sp. SCR17]|nr:MOSC domain-containing protein [Carideicomes alvinocaridis]